MNQQIKAGDYVYIPTYSHKALKVIKNPESNVRPLRVFINDDTFIGFHENGLSSKYHIEPIAFLATPENKAKIEAFYGCQLEDIPVDEELEDFINELNELSNFYIKLKSSDGNSKASDKMEELKSIKNNLIQMFKEKDSK